MQSRLGATALSDTTFSRMAEIVRRDTGISLSANKKNFLVSRLSKRLRELECEGFEKYCDILDGRSGEAERRIITSLLTTNVTNFFRENHHFEALEKEILPPLIKRAKAGSEIRIWSAGCSTGEEPHSIAVKLLETMPDAPRFDVSILATDIDPEVLKTGRSGRYSTKIMSPVPANLRAKYFLRQPGADDAFEAKPVVKNLIKFEELNLNSSWSRPEMFDIIFCRNVVIYFDADTQITLWKKFARHLRKGGFLLVGHSERVNLTAVKEFEHAGVTIYRRV